MKSTFKKAKNKKLYSSIPQKDIKLLWSRAAGRCSMQNCRKSLTLERNSESIATLGAMCHIVGEKTSASRGKSKLGLKDRNKYSNLILLCAHDHDIVDKYEKKYTIELLQKIKFEHESWVEKRLAHKKHTLADKIYWDIIDLLVKQLQLKYWGWFIDNATRNLIHEDFFSAKDIITIKYKTILWPKKKVLLEKAIKNLIQSYFDYIEQFKSHSLQIRFSDYFSGDKSFKRTFPNPNYDILIKKYDNWTQKNFLFLCKYVIMLNKFCDSVRKYLDSNFFAEKGKFLIVESTGMYTGNGIICIEPELKSVNRSLKKLKPIASKTKRKNKE
jgi:hypothetical protein